MHPNALVWLGESNKKEERVPDGPTIKYSQGIQNSCIISSLASVLYYVGDEILSEYIIRRKQHSFSFIHSKGRMQFCRDTLMGQQREKNELKIHYHIQEWNTFMTTYDILQNHYNYPTVCLLLETSHRTDHCINVCGKRIFDSNLEFTLPLTKAWLNYICSGNTSGWGQSQHQIWWMVEVIWDIKRRLYNLVHI